MRNVCLADKSHEMPSLLSSEKQNKTIYSRTSMARTPMALLPWMSRTRSRVRRDFLQIRYTDNLGRFSTFILQMYAVCTH